MKSQKRFTKQCLLAATTMLAPFIAQAQWATSGGNIYNTNAGNVGIGTTSPTYKLQVEGPTYLNGTTHVNGTAILYGNISWQSGGSILSSFGNKNINMNGSNWGFSSGKVGIGTTTPTYTLDVSGTFRATGNSYFTSGIVSIGSTPLLEKLEVAGNISLTPAANRRIYMGGQAGGTFGLAYDRNNPNFGIFYTEGSPDYVSISPNGNATNGSMNVYGDGKATIATALTIGTSGTACPDAALNVSTASTPAIYAYSTSAGNGVGVYSQGERIGAFGLAGFSPDCPSATSYYGNTGVAGSALGNATNDAVGVEGYAKEGTTAIGVRGIANLASYQNIGVMGSAPAGVHDYAGYFIGATYCSSGLWSGSDRKLKDNISPLGGALDKIMALKPASYTFKTKKYKTMNLPEGDHFGLIAQELETVFPDMVKNNIQPEMKDKEGKIVSEKVEFKSVNYTELIPVLIAAMQEQQETIIGQKEELQALRAEIAEIKATLGKTAINNSTAVAILKAGGSRLEQSIPNPAGNSARVAYYIAEDAGQATIILSRADGAEVKRYSIMQKGAGAIVIDAAALRAGEYIYSLVTNNGIVDSKKMIVVK